MTFQPGDLVVHKSDPFQPMTVDQVEEDGVACSWKKDGKVTRDKFPPTSLAPYEPDVLPPISH